MKRIARAFTVAALIMAVSCVNIPDTMNLNIDVTIRHIQEQAEEVLDFVEGKTDELELEAPPVENTSYLRQVWEFVSPMQTAHAQTNKSSPRVKQIASKMKERYNAVKAVKQTGAVGESNRGLLELVEPGVITDAEKKNEVQRVIAAENDDRKALYKEVARINSDSNMTVTQVENIYAAEYRDRASSGELIQVPAGGKEFEDFKASATGKALGNVQPNAWVKKP